MTSEYAIEDYLVNRVKAAGGMTLKGAVPGQRFLDRVVILPRGRTAFVELKRPKGGRATAHQSHTLDRLRALGHEAWLLRTWEDVDRFMRYGDLDHDLA